MKKTIIYIMIAAAAFVYAGDDDVTAVVSRYGKRVEPDGFLLEWNLSQGRGFGASQFIWDAIITSDGVAGYFSATAHKNALCSAWTFSIAPANAGAYRIEIPQTMRTEIFAFYGMRDDDQDIYNIEWVVPWSAFGKHDESADAHYEMTISGANVCGDTLPEISVTILRRADRDVASNNIMLYGIIIVVMSVAFIVTTVMRGVRRK